MRITSFLLFAFSLSFQFNAQQYCTTDELHQQLYSEKTGIGKKVLQNHLQLEAFTKAYSKANYGKQRAITYTIPVVFHIIHLDGIENISDAQILDQVRIINEDYQKRNADTANTINDFKGISADCEIEFKLAQLDPDGNCTSGITRHFDSRTLTGDHSVKEIIHWDPSMYLNIYVCSQAAGLAGHALVPAAADTISEWDGIVISHNYVGDIGTGAPNRSVVLTHEIGHYLNLQHTWGGNNVPGYPYLPVGDAGNCSYDDDVTDTPNTIGWSNCNLSNQSCGTLDNVQNFMEYAYCPTMFTEGQKMRMHAALNSSIANRNNLWSASNLVATGVNVSSYCAAEFDVDNTLVCEGTTLNFTDLSYNNVSEWMWYFDGGTPATSTDQNPTVTYNNPGVYQVKLVSGNGIDFDSVTKSSLITVLPSPGPGNSLIEGFEGNSISLTHLIPLDETGFASWATVSNASASGDYSLKLNNLEAVAGENNTLISDAINLSSASAMNLTFDYAFAKPTNSTVSDYLRVSVSNDCGETWSIRKQLNGSALLTKTDSISTDFVPSSSEWKSVSVTNISSSFWTSDFRIKFEFVKNNGNNFYLDNINLLDPAMSSIEKRESGFSLFPNPANDKLSVSHDFPGNIDYKIYNYLGELVISGALDQSLEIGIQTLPAGSYFVQLLNENQNMTQRFVKY